MAWKWKVKVALCDPMDYTVYGIIQAIILEWVALPFSRGSSQLRFEPRSLTLQADSLPAEPQGKPKSTGVGSLSLPQWIFPTQESNWGLLHCRRILYQLSYQGSPELWLTFSIFMEFKYNLSFASFPVCSFRVLRNLCSAQGFSTISLLLY